MRAVVCFCVLLAFFALERPVFAQGTLKTGLQSLPGALPVLEKQHADYSWDFDLSREKYYVSVPKSKSGALPYGLFVFISPTDECTSVPQGWESVLREKRLIFIAPQNAGNAQPVSRRMGLAVLAASKLPEMAKIDTNRVYVAGFSGGARMASHVSFLCPSLFSGVFAVCGVDYCRKVPRVKATKSDEYGFFSVEGQLAEAAKKKVKYVLVTGSKDFRYGNILDIYSGGYQQDGYQVKLFDVPGMEHTLCSSKVLDDGIGFFEKKSGSAAGKTETVKRFNK